MSRSLEITGRFVGERFRFDNADGTSVMIGSMLIAKSSRQAAIDAGIDDPDSTIGIKGECDIDELQVNKTYRFFGTWAPYFNRRAARKEIQFAFRTFVDHVPHDRDGVIEYLAAAGKGRGIGPRKAELLVDAIGVDEVLLLCREMPAEVANIAGVRRDQAQSFAEQLRSQAATESATLEVDKLLHGRGFPRTLVRRVIKAWGNHAAATINDDPYALMQFRGVGFGLTDKLFIGLGKDPSSVMRQAMAMWHSMASDNDGHTWFDADGRVRALQSAIGSKIDPRAAIIQGKEFAAQGSGHYGSISTIRTVGKDGTVCESGDALWLAESANAEAERYVAEAIARAQSETFAQTVTAYDDYENVKKVVLEHGRCDRCHRQLTASTVHVLGGVPYGPTCIGYVDPAGRHEVHQLRDWLEANPIVHRWITQQPAGVINLPEVSLWPDPSSLADVTDHQREQVANALTGRVAILGGSPGTGKTHVTAAIIKAIHASGLVGMHEIGVFAPTGKAAVRLSMALAKHDIRLRARTAHSLLGVGEVDDSTDSPEWSFQHNENNPWPYKVIVADEQSMPPINMMAAVFKARSAGCHFLLVGDVNQLPPVGNGAPFRDMIDAGMPYGELRTIMRNDGGIVQACADIRDQKEWVNDYRDGSKNLMITGESDADRQIERAMKIIQGKGSEGYDPVWDCQILTAVNEKSKLSRKSLNKVFQDALNNSPAIDGTPFRLGDKVVCLKNGHYETTSMRFEDLIDSEANARGEVYVANGELGRVENIDDKSITVKLDHPARLIRVVRGKSETKNGETSTGCNWDLGYALSVHKYQGSEGKVIIGFLDGYFGARGICDRAWIYTLISRAQEWCYLVGPPELARRFCKVQKMSQRKTFLANRIKLAMFNLEAVGL